MTQHTKLQFTLDSW